jgi:hypothetical protein
MSVAPTSTPSFKINTFTVAEVLLKITFQNGALDVIGKSSLSSISIITVPPVTL